MNNTWPYTVPGIPDNEFIRGKVPMTKQEIRALTISKARLKAGLTVWDVGAGSGSLTVEAALFTPGGQIFAIERSEEGNDLIRKNCGRFGVDHVTVVPGEAPGVLSGLPVPDRVIIGGSGGRLAEILGVCAGKLRPGGIVVLNLLTPRNLHTALEILGTAPFTEPAGVYLQASRLDKLGSELYFKAANGIWVLSAQKEGAH
ncbi:MAG: precorrin-6Y C5,15-methyltransferase (decarboxylating) subunit CbiT [Bacillota bacterium]|nr:precorrin-6Y C5,15-methyltransferase (decarboxylating) subunit CbiT [Bacillota bacterium]